MPNLASPKLQDAAHIWRSSGVVAATALVCAVTGSGMFARSVFGLSVTSLPDLVALYMLAIVATALRYGRTASVLAAAFSVAAYDFVFVPPYWTLAVTDARHMVTFVTMFVVGLVINELAARLRQREQEARVALLQARTEEMRSTLLSTVSHDLRTPLAAITGAATTLRHDRAHLSETQRADLLEAVCEESERMERLISNLLEMTRLEAGGALDIHAEWVPVEELLSSALGRLDGRIGPRDVKVELQERLPLVYVDPVLMEQVFMNLLDNALKFSPAGTELRVAAQASEGTLVVQICDRGPGFGRVSPHVLFEKFVRGEHRGVSGAGLGLAICKALMEAHHGSIRAQAREGGGAVFEVSLPLASNPPHVSVGEAS